MKEMIEPILYFICVFSIIGFLTTVFYDIYLIYKNINKGDNEDDNN